MPRFSVIVPLRNAEGTLAGALGSACAQTVRDIEILCVDDGSTDGTGAALAAFAARDARVRVVAQRNAGAAAARNRALGRSVGRWVVFLDADDRYPDADALARLARAAARCPGVPVVGGAFARFASAAPGVVTRSPFVGDHRRGLVAYREAPVDFAYQRFAFDRLWLEAHGLRFPDYRFYEDPPFLVRALALAGRYGQIKEVVYLYRDDPGRVRWEAEGFVRLRHLLLGMRDEALLARAFGLDRLAVRLRQRLLVEWWAMLRPCHAALVGLPEFRLLLAALPVREARRVRRGLMGRGRDTAPGRCLRFLRKLGIAWQDCGWHGVARLAWGWAARRLGPSLGWGGGRGGGG